VGCAFDVALSRLPTFNTLGNSEMDIRVDDEPE
jgi:hypothetical protein